jgi:hypothetical protein
MQAAGKDLPDAKDNNAIKAYFAEVYPDMDFDRVYGSDMKKMIKWFGQITEAGIELKEREVTADDTAEAPAEVAE